MAQASFGKKVLASVFDRLFDDDVKEREEPPSKRFVDLAQIKRSVARDLEALLNSRRELPQDTDAEFAEVRNSLLSYGLPEFIGLGLQNPDDRIFICRALEEAIALSEPRLKAIRVVIDTSPQGERALHFRVDALLQIKPLREPVTFDAVLHLNSSEYTVRREG
jgi:type VI secretion system protein ImpF